MNMYLLIGLAGITLFTALPLFFKKHRTKYNIGQFIKVVLIVLSIILFVKKMNTPFILAIIVGCLVFILLDKKTYTKKRMIIYTLSIFTIICISIISSYVLLKSNPEYTLNHIMKNQKNSSLYVSVNDEEIIAYQSNVPRPLASVVKIVIALEYSYQIQNGDIQEDDPISLDNLDQYYLQNYDGGAHMSWIKHMEESGKIQNNTVLLQDVAKGMIAFSSNANTDYLINLLGVHNINNRIAQLELHDHDDVYPIVGGLLIINEFKKEHNDTDWMTKLRNMPNNEYKELALKNSKKMSSNDISLEGTSNLPLKEQQIWSDRLPNASAKTYGILLHMIANDLFPEKVSTIMRDLMEWPMEMVEENKEDYHYLGAKGGSTAFVYNQAIYVKNLDGNNIEFVILMDQLSMWENFMLRHHTNSFIVEMVNNEKFREMVKTKLIQ